MNSNWIWATLLVFLAFIFILLRSVPKEAKSHHVVLPKNNVNNSDLKFDCPANCKSILRFEGSKMIINCLCPQDSGLE